VDKYNVPFYLYKCVRYTTNAIVCGFMSEGHAVSRSVREAMAGRDQHSLSESEVWESRDLFWREILMMCSVGYSTFFCTE
jgi:hypothetical protein